MATTESNGLPPRLVGAVLPRFHFHVFDGRDRRDDDGTELSNFEEARVEAVRSAGEILKDDAHRIALVEDWHIDVADDTGLILFRLQLSTVTSPAISCVTEAGQRLVTAFDPQLAR